MDPTLWKVEIQLTSLIKQERLQEREPTATTATTQTSPYSQKRSSRIRTELGAFHSILNKTPTLFQPF